LIFLEAAINGARAPAEHAGLPVTPAEQARAAADCWHQGADAVHAHVRDDEGRETLAAGAVGALMRAVRAAAPALPVGISTGAWIVPDPEERAAHVRAWRARPDFASVNFDEAGAADVANALLALRVGVEAGLASPAAAEAFVASGLAPRCLRVLLEPQEKTVPEALATSASIEQVLSRAGISLPLLLHGIGVTVWPLLAEAARRGCQARIGLEDTLLLPGGELATDNAELVAAARRVLADASRALEMNRDR
jgi:uncharacterized protein (DUF849 family)